MKIAVSATSGNLDAQIDPTFGRCPYFVIVDSETMKFEAVPNIATGAMGGAGIQATQTVANRGVQVVLTGSVGPNAFQALSSTGINVITEVSGTVREAVEKFKSGKLQKIGVSSTFTGFGMEMGRGGGRGRGRGGGRGMGFRRWQVAGPLVPQAPISPVVPTMLPQMSKEQEIQMLENQMKDMQKQLDQIRKRLEELKK